MYFGAAQSKVLLAQNEAQLAEAVTRAVELARQTRNETLVQLLTMVQLEMRMKAAQITDGELKRFYEIAETSRLAIVRSEKAH